MKPELTPGLATRNDGSPRWPEMSLYVRRSEILASSASDTAR